jgi:transposase
MGFELVLIVRPLVRLAWIERLSSYRSVSFFPLVLPPVECQALCWGERWRWSGGSVALPVEERESVDAGLRQIVFLDAEIKAVEKLIAQQALRWPELRRLMTVPGANLICAATFIAAIGRADRFLTSRKLVA